MRGSMLEDAGESSWGEGVRGGVTFTGVAMSEISPGVVVPCVAAADWGEGGGSGERVKYTTLASDPPTFPARSAQAYTQGAPTHIDCYVRDGLDVIGKVYPAAIARL